MGDWIAGEVEGAESDEEDKWAEDGKETVAGGGTENGWIATAAEGE